MERWQMLLKELLAALDQSKLPLTLVYGDDDNDYYVTITKKPYNQDLNNN